MQEDLLEQANAIGKNTLLENFEISFIEVGKDYLIAQMPVTEKNCQINITMNHIRPAALGKTVFAKATLIHKGSTLQHWDIKITDEDNKLISYGKHTTIIVKKR